MYQFFVETHQIIDGQVTIEGTDVNHIKNVLRMKPGEKIRVSDPDGVDYFCSITDIADEKVNAVVERIDEQGSELQSKIYLFQGLPKGDKMELIIQKAVELGAYEIIPVAMKNCVVKLDDKKAQAKVKRWQAISESAAKQSKRSTIPQIHPVMTYKEALKYAEECDCCLLPYENALGIKATEEALKEAQSAEKIAVFVGAEGGFDPSEIELAQSAKKITLGKRILRTETAAIAMMTMLMYKLECAAAEKEI